MQSAPGARTRQLQTAQELSAQEKGRQEKSRRPCASYSTRTLDRRISIGASLLGVRLTDKLGDAATQRLEIGIAQPASLLATLGVIGETRTGRDQTTDDDVLL